MTIRLRAPSFNQGENEGELLHNWSLMTATVYEAFWPYWALFPSAPACLCKLAVVAVSSLAEVHTGKREMRGGDGARNGQLQHLLPHSTSHFNLSVSDAPSRRNVECVGESDLQLTLVVRKRMLAFTRCLWITKWKSFCSTLLLPGHLFQGGQNTRELRAKDALSAQ